MSFLVVNIAAPWQLASENIASLDFFPSLAEKARLPYRVPG